MEHLLALLPLVLFFICTTTYGVNKTLARTPTIANRLGQGVFDGRLKTTYDYYESDGSEGAADIIEMGPKFPKGTKMVEVILDTDALGGNATLEVGDYEDPNRYITATDHGAAALITRMNIIAGRMYEMDDTSPGATTSDRQVIMTVGVSAITGSIKLILLTTHD